MENSTEKICLKKKKKEYMKEYRKNQSNNLSKKIKENDELKSVELDLEPILSKIR